MDAGDSAEVFLRQDEKKVDLELRQSLNDMAIGAPPKDNERDRWLARPLPAKLVDAPSIAAYDVDVRSNLYRMDTSCLKPINKYRIDMTLISDSKERDITRGAKHDYATQARRRVMFSLLMDVMKKCEKDGLESFGDKYDVIYDCGNILYVARKLSKDDLLVTLQQEDVCSQNSKDWLGKFVKINVSIRHVLSASPVMNGALEDVRETMQYLEVLTSAMTHKNGDHFMFHNKSYDKSSSRDAPIGDGKVVKSGNEKNCRLIEQNGKSLPALQIDAKKSPFFAGQSLVKFLCELLNVRDGRDLSRALSDRSVGRKVNTQLKDLWVETNHLSRKRPLAIHSLSQKNASETTFDFDEEHISVRDYYARKYKCNLKYPELPLIVERRPQGNSYHPMEVLEVVRGQRVNCNKSTPQMAEKMIKECQLKPCDMIMHIEDQLKQLDLCETNKYLMKFGVTVSTRSEGTKASLLHPPAIKYASNTVEPQRDGTLQWKLGGRERFIKPASLTNPFFFVIFDRCTQQDRVRQFIDLWARCGQDHGMNIDVKQARIVELFSDAHDKIDDLFHKAAKEKYQMIWAITKQKLDPVHDVLKRLEARYTVVTQHLSMQTFMKACGNQGAYMVLGNLISKSNPKLGGVNHVMDVSRAFLAANPTDKTAATRLFPKDRMFIGLDVAHAGPQSYSERQLNIEQSEPTVCGMSYTLGLSTEMRGFYWMQKARLAKMSQLEAHMALALEERLKTVGRLPDDIVVYRGGVSEGEFGKVDEEMEELMKAFGRHTGRNGVYNPALTCIVVQTNSNYRIVPNKIDSRARPMDQNVKPGTCVSSDITNPAYNEFILVPQRALQGTARPIRCTLVTRKSGSSGSLLSMDDMKLITNSLSYGHQVVCGPTGVPSVIYSATNLTKRGRNIWKQENFGADSDTRSEVSGGSGGKLRYDGSEGFFEAMTKNLRSNVRSHYWA